MRSDRKGNGDKTTETLLVFRSDLTWFQNYGKFRVKSSYFFQKNLTLNISEIAVSRTWYQVPCYGFNQKGLSNDAFSYQFLILEGVYDGGRERGGEVIKKVKYMQGNHTNHTPMQAMHHLRIRWLWEWIINKFGLVSLLKILLLIRGKKARPNKDCFPSANIILVLFYGIATKFRFLC